jgi:biotin carboxyl carrier protein
MKVYRIEVNGNVYAVRVKSILGDRAVVDVDGLEFNVNIGGNPSSETPPVRISAPSQSAQVRVKEPVKKRASMIDQVSSSKSSTHSGKGMITAHLPGLILEIFVKPGDPVKSGDLVMKMEAMKMVNEVRSKIDGTVKDVLVAVQQNVLENQPLLIIE